MGEATDLEAERTLFGPVSSDLAEIEGRLLSLIEADPDVVSAPMTELFAAGGKRIRPGLVLLAAKTGLYDLERIAPAAMAVELTHAATLVHDDVIDRATVRRGRPTVAARLGDEPAIVVGDFYFAKAYEQAAATDSAEVVMILARAVMEICAGEVRQQSIRHYYDTGIDEYMARIEAKTATLLSACCDIGGVLGGLDGRKRASLRAFGRLLGLAFQIADDVLDYTGSEAEVGKPIGHDVAEGFATLPLMLAMDDAEVAAKLGGILDHTHQLSASEAQSVVSIVRASRGPQMALERASGLASDARRELTALGNGEVPRCLSALTSYVVTRKF